MQNRFFSTPNSLALAICVTALFLFTSQSVAQEATPFLAQIQNSTPEQQINYVIEARKRGYSLPQLESIAKTQGASLEELLLLRKAWSDSQSSVEAAANIQITQNEKTPLFGNESNIFSSSGEKSDIFGSSFFANKRSACGRGRQISSDSS